MIGRIEVDRPVLVVDDTNSTRYSTVRLLRAAGVQILEATTGEEALALAPGCGAVVLDVNLPDIDGFEVCRRLRAGTLNARVPVVHLSAQRMRDEDKIRGLEAGADAYLTHPVDPGVMTATINALLRARAAEDSEKLSRARFEAVFRSAPVGIAVVDSAGHVLEINDEMRQIAEAMGGIGQPTPDIDTLLAQVLHECETCGSADMPGPTFVSPAGYHLPVHLNCRLTRLDDATRLVLVVDVTRQHQLQLDKESLLERERAAREAAENASRAKDSFLALLSHELRNPLAPISSAAQLLQRAPSDVDIVKRVSGVITRQVSHMRELIDDLMDVSRVTRGLVELANELVELQDVVHAAVEQIRPLIEAREHVATVEMPTRPVVVRGDRTRLVQVVANLLNNAAKYTPHRGRLQVRVAADAAFAMIDVTDDGVGVSAELLPHVFDLFTQAERTPDRAQGGLGVGLALVKSVVALHGGRVEARSDGVGQGSAFRVILPVAAGERVVVPPVALEPDSGSALHVMVVDDNEDAAATLADVLRLMGHRVAVAHHPQSALEMLESLPGPPDVFVLDIGLPGMTGYELAAAIREHHSSQDALFVALTGYSQPSDITLSSDAQFFRHLVKPVAAATLAEVIGAAQRELAKGTPSADLLG